MPKPLRRRPPLCSIAVPHAPATRGRHSGQMTGGPCRAICRRPLQAILAKNRRKRGSFFFFKQPSEQLPLGQRIDNPYGPFLPKRPDDAGWQGTLAPSYGLPLLWATGGPHQTTGAPLRGQRRCCGKGVGGCRLTFWLPLAFRASSACSKFT